MRLEALTLEPANGLASQFVRYILVGFVALAVDMAVLIALTEWAGVHYLSSAALAFCVAMTASYGLSVRWVFDHRSWESKRFEYALFAAVGVVGLGLTELILYVGVAWLQIDYRLAKLFAVVSVCFWNFGVRKALLFSPKRTIA